MISQQTPAIFTYLLFLLAACAPQLANPANVDFVTAVPTLDVSDPALLCEVAAQNEGANWQLHIDALEALWDGGYVCGDGVPINDRLYHAYLAYGKEAENSGDVEHAITLYHLALDYTNDGTEAQEQLARLNPEPQQLLEICDQTTVDDALSQLQPYTPTEGNFAEIINGQLIVGIEPYFIYGVNYYPRNTPFERFLTETDVEIMDAELDIIAGSDINTLRIFLRFDDLFTCPGNGAVPNMDTFSRLDAMIQRAVNKGFKLIIVLHQDADLVDFPLYESQEHIIQQLRFILERYQGEPGILLWDLRDQGDNDYLDGNFESADVLDWLTRTTQIAHETAPNHLITASWVEDVQATIPIVDVVSFQHFGEYESLRQRVAVLKDTTDKPILLSAIGYSTNLIDETAQRNLLFQSFEEIENNNMAGWVIYMAFDYPLSVTCIEPDCPGEPRPLNFYGIWNTSYFPKLAVGAVERVTGTEESEE